MQTGHWFIDLFFTGRPNVYFKRATLNTLCRWWYHVNRELHMVKSSI